MSEQPAERVAPTTTDDLDAAQTELLALLQAEFAEGGVVTELVPGADGAPTQLVYPLPVDGSGREVRISAFFVPGVDEPAAVQYFSALPYRVEPGHLAATAEFVCRLNADLPVTGFEVAFDAPAIAFRHTHAISVRPLDPGVIAWTLSMAGAAISTFGRLVEQVGADGTVDAATAEAARIFESLAD